jgi:S-methylmethionine-dependent homocysteine/selenocysteine methylase
MTRYRNGLPQLSDDLFLMDAGLETDLIFNHGIDIPEFASHTLLPDPKGREAMVKYYRDFLSLAGTTDAGFLLGVPIWKAHMHWAKDLGASEDDLRQANFDAVAFVSGLRDEFSENAKPIVLDGIIGPRGDAYAPDEMVAINEAEQYHAKQIGWLVETNVDMVTGLTFTQSDEAIGFVRAARAAGIPSVMSFTVETDGKLPTGQSLGEAIQAVDDKTDQAAAYFMVNCAHPDHFSHVLDDEAWTRRIRGIRCNASRQSHAELDACEVLDDGNPVELGGQYRTFKDRMPWLNVFGGCCGSDLRHVEQIAKAMAA